jgi:DNA-binding Xre family transcriptional regulator
VIRHYQKLESGMVNVTLKTLERLGKALDVDPGDLLASDSPRSRSRTST